MSDQRGQEQAPKVDRPPRPTVAPEPPPPSGGAPSSCMTTNRCQMTPHCRHYGGCRIADVLFERTKGRRL
jgi:hypothetical protein